MQRIAPTLLNKLGINLSDHDRDSLLEHITASLEERVGQAITLKLSDEQLDEMLDIEQDGDKSELQQWLQENVSDLQEIISIETDLLLGELAEQAPSLGYAPHGA